MRPLKVQQRGTQASSEVIQALLDGTAAEGSQPARVFIMDLVPNRRAGTCVLSTFSPMPNPGRYNEWGRAVLQKQKLNLQTPTSMEFYFSAFASGQCHEKELSYMKGEIAAALMTAGVP